MPPFLTPTTPLARLDLPPEVQAVLHHSRTAECTTLGRDGTPVTVQASPLWQPARGQFLLTTSIGAPNKAFNARRDPRVSLLFSNPTASGLHEPPAVLVQGDARVSELSVWDDDLAEFWPWMDAHQPASRAYSASTPMRWLMDWYFMRLKIHVTPRRIRWWSRGDMARSPREVVLVSPTVERPPRVALARPAAHLEASAWESTARALRRFPTAVLTVIDASGDPASARCVPRQDPAERVLRLDVPAWLDAQPGPACLMSHRHDAQLWGLDGFLARGVLEQQAADRRFRPSRYVPSMSASVLDTTVTILKMRRRAGRYLAHRGLPRPRVPWDLLAGAKKPPFPRDGDS